MQPLLFWLLWCSRFIIIFLVKKRKPLFSNHIKVKYLVTVIVYPSLPNKMSFQPTFKLQFDD